MECSSALSVTTKASTARACSITLSQNMSTVRVIFVRFATRFARPKMLSAFIGQETTKIMLVFTDFWNTQLSHPFFLVDLDAQVSSLLAKQMDGAWACTECGYKSNVKTNVKMHVESKHLVSEGFSCPTCQLLCPNRKSLRNHMTRKHSQNPNNPNYL